MSVGVLPPPTTPAEVSPDEDDFRRVRLVSFDRRSWIALAASAATSYSIVWLWFNVLSPMTGSVGFWLCTFGLFCLVYWLVNRELEGPVVAADRFMGTIIATGGAMLVVPLVFIVGYVVKRGVEALTWHFFTQTLATVGPLDPASAGGAAHAIVGTLQEVGLAVLITVPLGFLCAIFLNEIGGPLRRPVRTFVDAMSGVPTIVAGLFIYAVWVVGLHQGFSGWAATLAISISMLPLITRTSEEILRLVPDGLRESSLALGATEWKTVRGVVLPTARSGLITAVILGIARAVGETAPLLMTSFGSSTMNTNPFKGAQMALPLFVYRNLTSSSDAQVQRGWTGALVLIMLVLTLFTLARYLGSRAAKGGRLRRAPERFR
jgi:phosphate transport system permease protein